MKRDEQPMPETNVKRLWGVSVRSATWGRGALHGAQNGVVAAARTPADLLVALEISLCIVVLCHNDYFNKDSKFSTSSTTVKG